MAFLGVFDHDAENIIEEGSCSLPWVKKLRLLWCGRILADFSFYVHLKRAGRCRRGAAIRPGLHLSSTTSGSLTSLYDSVFVRVFVLGVVGNRRWRGPLDGWV